VSTIHKQGRPARGSDLVRIGILSTDGGRPGRVAWVTAGAGGISIGVARAGGPGTRYVYRNDGGFYRATQPKAPGQREALELVAKHPPVGEVRGLLQLLSVDAGAGDRLRGFPFKRRFEPVFVRPLNGRTSFRLGLLEPGVPQALDTVKKDERHFRLFTRTDPWMLLWNSAGFETAAR